MENTFFSHKFWDTLYSFPLFSRMNGQLTTGRQIYGRMECIFHENVNHVVLDVIFRPYLLDEFRCRIGLPLTFEVFIGDVTRGSPARTIGLVGVAVYL